MSLAKNRPNELNWRAIKPINQDSKINKAMITNIIKKKRSFILKYTFMIIYNKFFFLNI